MCIYTSVGTYVYVYVTGHLSEYAYVCGDETQEDIQNNLQCAHI